MEFLINKHEQDDKTPIIFLDFCRYGSNVGAAVAEFAGFKVAFALVGVMAVIGFLILLRLQTNDK